jgi:hypothetical protein
LQDLANGIFIELPLRDRPRCSCLPNRRLNGSTPFRQPAEITNKTEAPTEFFWHMNCSKKFHG